MSSTLEIHPSAAAAAPIRLSRVPAVVDDVTVRLVAGVVVAAGVTALLTQQWWLYALLFIDFALRSAVGPRWSPVGRIAAAIRPLVPAAPRSTAFAPKRFAAGIGAAMTAVITGLWAAHLATGAEAPLVAATALAVVMIVLPALEAALGFCVGCVLFAGLIRVGLIPADVCVDCAPSAKRRS